jgi:hypothetical protein
LDTIHEWHLGSVSIFGQDAGKYELRYFELFGETMREMGLLLLVFVPLDATFYQGSIAWPALVGLVILGICGFVLVIVGIWLEGSQ